VNLRDKDLKLNVRKMKAFRLPLLLAGSLLFILGSCDKEKESEAIDESPAELEAAYDDAFEEVDAIVESTMDYFIENGRIAEAEEENELIRCGIKTHDFENKTITIDFGDGCKGWGGRIRKGKIIITYTDRKFVPGN
jgi:hypothetical protein